MIHKKNVDNYKDGRTETGYSREGYEKFYTDDIIGWIHPKWGKTEKSEECQHENWKPKAKVSLGRICHNVHRQLMDPGKNEIKILCE